MTSIAEPSVRSLLIQMQFQGHPLATGTGVITTSAAGPVLVTNWHNLAGRHPQTKQPLSATGAIPDEVVIIHNRAGKLGEWVSRTETLTSNGQPRWTEHPTLGDQADVVAVPLQQLDDVELYPYAGLGQDDRKIFCGDAGWSAH